MTDYGELAADLIQKHFPKFGTFRKFCTYTSLADSDYDTDSGDVTEVPITGQSETLYIIFSEFAFTAGMAPERKFSDVAILSIDKIAIFPSLDLPFEPEIGDSIVDDVFVTWNVMGKAEDPKPAHYELHVRPQVQGVAP